MCKRSITSMTRTRSDLSCLTCFDFLERNFGVFFLLHFFFFFPKGIHAWIQISNLSGLFPPSLALNFLMNVLHIFKYAPSRNEDVRISLGYRDSCLAALTMATVPPSDCHSSLCIYANVCLDITDSCVIVSLPAFKKIWLKSTKTESDRTTEHFCNSRRTGGLHANNHISIAKSFYCH